MPTRPERVAVGLLLALAAWILMAPPLVGLANSGDFLRVMDWGGLTYARADEPDRFFKWVVPTLAYKWWPPIAVGWYLTSEAPIAKLAATLGWLANPWAFDLRWLGLVHLLLFAGSLGLLMVGFRRATGLSGAWLAPGLALVFCDAGYLVYFHSFFSEPAALIFLLSTAGLGLALAGGPPSERLVRAFFWSLLLFMAAKSQTMTLAAPILAYLGWLWLRADGGPLRARVPRFAAIIAGLAVVQYLATPPNMIEANRFATVFNGILRDSATPEQDLRDLGLPPEYARLKDHDIFQVPQPVDIWSPDFYRRFHAVHSHRKVALFYLGHPDRFVAKMRVTAEHAFTLRPDYLGNTVKAAGLPGYTLTDRWSAWTRLKAERLPHTLGFVVGCGLAALAVLLLAARLDRGRLRRGPATFLLTLLAMAAIAYVTPILGDGQSDLDKHLFLFDALFDLGVVLASGLVLGTLASGAARRAS